MPYSLLIIIHLFCAITFIGTVFFEVLILESVRKRLSAEIMNQVQMAITIRARRFMPLVILFLFLSGIGMAMHHFSNIEQMLTSSFGQLLGLKILLAFSVLAHFIYAMRSSIKGTLSCDSFEKTHLSVFIHQIGIILLAKGMFFFSW